MWLVVNVIQVVNRVLWIPVVFFIFHRVLVNRKKIFIVCWEFIQVVAVVFVFVK